MWWRYSLNGGGMFHFWHVQDKNTLAALRFVHWSNRSYVLNNFSLEYRLYLANCAETRPSAGLHLLSRSSPHSSAYYCTHTHPLHPPSTPRYPHSPMLMKTYCPELSIPVSLAPITISLTELGLAHITEILNIYGCWFLRRVRLHWPINCMLTANCEQSWGFLSLLFS